MRKILSIFTAMLCAIAVNAVPVVLPATLDVNNVSFRSEGMPDFVIEEGQDYAGTYFDMGAHDSSNDTLLYAEWDVTIEPIKYNIAVDVYNTNSWRVQLYLLNQAGDTLKSLRYKGSSGQCGQYGIGSMDLSDLAAGDYKLRARAATAWSAMKLKDVIFAADYQGVSVDLPGTLLPAYAQLSSGATATSSAIAFTPSTAQNEYATWNVNFTEAGNFDVTIDMTASNGHTYGVALLSADGATEIGAVAEEQAWDTGVKALGSIAVPAAGSYKVKLTNATQWSEAVLNSITFAAPAPVVDEWAEIAFSAPATVDEIDADASFTVDGFTVAITDPDNKMSIDANDCRFGTATDYKMYSHRLKSGGKSSATKNFMTLTIPEAGTLRIAVRTGSNSATDRNLVLKQGGDTIYNQVIVESMAVKVMEGETEVSVYPFVEVPVEAGTVALSYPVNGLNFYAFVFKAAGGDEPQPQECDWDAIDFLGDGSTEQTHPNQFKVCKVGEQPNVVNIQTPGFAAETGIYVTFPSAVFGEISLAEGQYVIEGAGIVLYLSAFTQEYTEVTVNWDGNDIVFTVYNAAAAPQPVEHTYTVAGGSADLFGTTWDPANTANDMTKLEDGAYKWEKTEVTLPAGNVEFKVVEDHAWTVCYPAENYQLVIPEAGVYTITITYNPEGNVVAGDAVKTGDAQVDPVVSIAGSMNSWNASADVMVLAEDKATASLTLNLAAQTYEFKVVINGGDWRSNAHEFTRENATAAEMTGNLDNMHLVADVAGDYIFTWTFATNTLAITFPQGEGINNTAVENQVVKMIENGQLIIIKNGVRYNAQGTIVR